MGVDVGSIDLDGLRIDAKNESGRRKASDSIDDRSSGCDDWCTDSARGRGGTTATDTTKTAGGCCVE